MSTYELDDSMVEAWLHGHPDGNFASALRAQLPIPAPVKVAAVVRTLGAIAPIDQPVTFVRWAIDAFTLSPWIQANNHEIPYRTDEIGRIVEVLSPGVDL